MDNFVLSFPQVARPVVDSLSPPREEETLLYLGVGAGLALLVSGVLLLSVLLLVAGKGRGRDNEPLINQSTSSGNLGSLQYDGGLLKEWELCTKTPLEYLPPFWFP